MLIVLMMPCCRCWTVEASWVVWIPKYIWVYDVWHDVHTGWTRHQQEISGSVICLCWTTCPASYQLLQSHEVYLSAIIFCLILVYFRLTPPSRPNKVGLKCPSVRPSTKSFFDFNDIWYVGRGWWVMCNGIQYDPIQHQGREPLNVGNSSIFKGYLLPHLQRGLANDHRFLN